MLVLVKSVPELSRTGYPLVDGRAIKTRIGHASDVAEAVTQMPSHSVAHRRRSHSLRLVVLVLLAACVVMAGGFTLGRGYAMMEGNGGTGDVTARGSMVHGAGLVEQDVEDDSAVRWSLGGALRNRLRGGVRADSAYQWVVVKRGDTVWSLARQTVGHQNDPRWLVDEIIRLNELGRGPLLEGQMLKIPVLRERSRS